MQSPLAEVERRRTPPNGRDAPLQKLKWLPDLRPTFYWKCKATHRILIHNKTTRFTIFCTFKVCSVFWNHCPSDQAFKHQIQNMVHEEWKSFPHKSCVFVFHCMRMCRYFFIRLCVNYSATTSTTVLYITQKTIRLNKIYINEELLAEQMNIWTNHQEEWFWIFALFTVNGDSTLTDLCCN